MPLVKPSTAPNHLSRSLSPSTLHSSHHPSRLIQATDIPGIHHPTLRRYSPATLSLYTHPNVNMSTFEASDPHLSVRSDEETSEIMRSSKAANSAAYVSPASRQQGSLPEKNPPKIAAQTPKRAVQPPKRGSTWENKPKTEAPPARHRLSHEYKPEDDSPVEEVNDFCKPDYPNPKAKYADNDLCCRTSPKPNPLTYVTRPWPVFKNAWARS